MNSMKEHEQKEEKTAKTTVETLTFVHRFNSRLTATLRVLDKPPAAPGLYRPKVEWSGGDPSSKITNAYRKWILDTNQILSDRWQIPMVYGLIVTATKMEVWEFIPGEKPQLGYVIQMED